MTRKSDGVRNGRDSPGVRYTPPDGPAKDDGAEWVADATDTLGGAGWAFACAVCKFVGVVLFGLVGLMTGEAEGRDARRDAQAGPTAEAAAKKPASRKPATRRKGGKG